MYFNRNTFCSFVKRKNSFDAKNQNIEICENFSLTAHTGCEKTKDNSIEAILSGISAGADIVEFDLNFNKDGLAVLSHDEPSGNEVLLKDAFFVLHKYKHIKINIDVKNTLDLIQVYNEALKYDIVDRIFFTGLFFDDIDFIKSLNLNIPYYLNFNIPKNKRKNSAFLDDIVSKTVNSGARGININYKSCSRKLVLLCRENNIEISVWTVNNKKDMIKMLSFGCDNITTRQPSLLKKLLK